MSEFTPEQIRREIAYLDTPEEPGILAPHERLHRDIMAHEADDYTEIPFDEDAAEAMIKSHRDAENRWRKRALEAEREVVELKGEAKLRQAGTTNTAIEETKKENHQFRVAIVILAWGAFWVSILAIWGWMR